MFTNNLLVFTQVSLRALCYNASQLSLHNFGIPIELVLSVASVSVLFTLGHVSQLCSLSTWMIQACGATPVESTDSVFNSFLSYFSAFC